MEQAAEAVRRVASSQTSAAPSPPRYAGKVSETLAFYPSSSSSSRSAPSAGITWLLLELHPLITPRPNSLRLLPQGCPQVPSHSVPARASLSKGSPWDSRIPQQCAIAVHLLCFGSSFLITNGRCFKHLSLKPFTGKTRMESVSWLQPGPGPFHATI